LRGESRAVVFVPKGYSFFTREWWKNTSRPLIPVLLCLFLTGQKIRIVLKITASGNGRLFTFRYRGLGIWGVTKDEKGVFLVVARRPYFFSVNKF
jgi:hypothetical protein